MPTSRCLPLFMVLFALATIALAEDPPATESDRTPEVASPATGGNRKGTPTALAKEEETPQGVRIELFNGRNLDGWQVTGCETEVQDGVLVAAGGDGFIRSDHRYSDFVLEWSCRPRKSEAWDSGVYFRCEPPSGKRPWPQRYQINLKQGDEGNGIGLPQAKCDGLVKPGGWNAYRLTVVGQRAEMEINGQSAWKTDGIEPADGYVGIQVEVPVGGQFEFKDIAITELQARPLFNGADLSGWEGGGSDASRCWRVEDGLLVCTGEKGPWLRTAEQFDEFNLRLDYKLKPKGNSGVYVRVPKNGAHWNAGEGVEVQILDDAAKNYAKLKPYQFSASIYKIAAAEPRVTRAAGEWNSLEIDCRGTSIVVVHNGIEVVRAAAAEYPELAERLGKGYLGLQNHSEHVWYRNLRIGPSLQQAAPQPESGAAPTDGGAVGDQNATAVAGSDEAPSNEDADDGTCDDGT